ncbi:MAG: hypothetical protein ACI4XP_09715 [Acutalibacteraceae bacterium]
MSNKINVFPDEIRSIVLKDDRTPYGGTAFVGETVGDFLDGLDEDEEVYSLEELNEHLVKCGIKPILQSCVFKSLDAYNKGGLICYITENGAECYCREDFLELAGGVEEVARSLFEQANWQSLETALDEDIRNGEIAECPKCGRLYLSYFKAMCDDCAKESTMGYIRNNFSYSSDALRIIDDIVELALRENLQKKYCDFLLCSVGLNKEEIEKFYNRTLGE